MPGTERRRYSGRGPGMTPEEAAQAGYGTDRRPLTAILGGTCLCSPFGTRQCPEYCKPCRAAYPDGNRCIGVFP